jgi:hypothetical protein
MEYLMVYRGGTSNNSGHVQLSVLNNYYIALLFMIFNFCKRYSSKNGVLFVFKIKSSPLLL